MKKPAARLFICFLTLYLSITLLPPILFATVPGPEALPGPEASLEPGSSQGPAESQEPGSSRETGSSSEPAPSPIPGPLDGAPIEGGTNFKLRDAATGELITVDRREFLIADLACEMDLHAPEEALKAQAVAAYTYYSRQRDSEIACDTESWLVYVTEEGMQERWGEDYEEYRNILERVVDSVEGQALTYEGELILASYFAISPGSTESVENVWAQDANVQHPYLQAVASPGDLFSDGYLSFAEFTAGELESALGLSGIDPASLFTDVQYTPSGTVKSLLAGDKEFTGQELRAALGLRSACFTWEPSEGGLRFTVRGWGHGVGMSQAGAVFMAKRGAGYEEILAHYYPGTELKK